MEKQVIISSRTLHRSLYNAMHQKTEADISILQLLEACFLSWGKELDTTEMIFPPIISIEDLTAINYFQDHPTQAVFLSALPPQITSSKKPYDKETEPLGYALNPAVCYHAYLSQRNQEIDQMIRISTQTSCYRNQPPYTTSGRMFCFTQRKLAFIGASQEVRKMLKAAEESVRELGNALGLDLQEKPSQAPNYTHDPKPGRIKALFLADKEFSYGNFPALCHTNFHRNYFCKRLDIRLSNGRYAFAGCLGVIPEYWLLGLKDKYKNNTDTIIPLIHQYLNNK